MRGWTTAKLRGGELNAQLEHHVNLTLITVASVRQ